MCVCETTASMRRSENKSKELFHFFHHVFPEELELELVAVIMRVLRSYILQSSIWFHFEWR